ncbi:OmpH family outer membrane protein [Bacteroides sp.]
MKRINCLINGLAALALIVLFSQCAGKADTKTTTTTDGETAAATVSGDLKIAYVEVDTLLSKYNFCIDLNEAMMKKEENIRMTLNQKAAALDKDQKEFQKKYENNAFISPERAQQEYNRLMKMQQDLQALQNKLTNELAAENQKNSLQLRDSINVFLKEYNKTRGYNLILSNTGFDNLLYADPSFNITKEIIDGLNARYTSKK